MKKACLIAVLFMALCAEGFCADWFLFMDGCTNPATTGSLAGWNAMLATQGGGSDPKFANWNYGNYFDIVPNGSGGKAVRFSVDGTRGNGLEFNVVTKAGEGQEVLQLGCGCTSPGILSKVPGVNSITKAIRFRVISSNLVPGGPGVRFLRGQGVFDRTRFDGNRYQWRVAYEIFKDFDGYHYIRGYQNILGNVPFDKLPNTRVDDGNFHTFWIRADAGNGSDNETKYKVWLDGYSTQSSPYEFVGTRGGEAYAAWGWRDSNHPAITYEVDWYGIALEGVDYGGIAIPPDKSTVSASSVIQVRNQTPGTPVEFTGVVSNIAENTYDAGNALHTDRMYYVSDGTGTVRVIQENGLQPINGPVATGNLVKVTGGVYHRNCEITVSATKIEKLPQTNPPTPIPPAKGMTNKNVISSFNKTLLDFNPPQIPTTTDICLRNDGAFAQVWGVVADIDANSPPKWVYVNDGNLIGIRVYNDFSSTNQIEEGNCVLAEGSLTNAVIEDTQYEIMPVLFSNSGKVWFLNASNQWQPKFGWGRFSN